LNLIDTKHLDVTFTDGGFEFVELSFGWFTVVDDDTDAWCVGNDRCEDREEFRVGEDTNTLGFVQGVG
jgi:hypothetical protein